MRKRAVRAAAAGMPRKRVRNRVEAEGRSGVPQGRLSSFRYGIHVDVTSYPLRRTVPIRETQRGSRTGRIYWFVQVEAATVQCEGSGARAVAAPEA